MREKFVITDIDLIFDSQFGFKELALIYKAATSLITTFHLITT